MLSMTRADYEALRKSPKKRRAMSVMQEAMRQLQLQSCRDGGGTTKPPYYLVRTDCWLDGGTVGVTLADRDGLMLRLCFDHRIDTTTDGCLYVGCIIPEGARVMLARGGHDEKAMLSLLRSVRGGLRADRDALKRELQRRRR